MAGPRPRIANIKFPTCHLIMYKNIVVDFTLKSSNLVIAVTGPQQLLTSTYVIKHKGKTGA